MIIRSFPNIVTADLAATTAWYLNLFEWQTQFESDWFVHLTAENAPDVELGVLLASHNVAPLPAMPGGSGVMLTFVVDDVDAKHQRAADLGYDIVETPTDLLYGQRRMVLRDPNGTLVDVSSPSVAE